MILNLLDSVWLVTVGHAGGRQGERLDRSRQRGSKVGEGKRDRTPRGAQLGSAPLATGKVKFHLGSCATAFTHQTHRNGLNPKTVTRF
jgi:hypothetical protein